jgi:hypothetical protein
MSFSNRTYRPTSSLSNAEEELLARLTVAAYSIALRRRPQGSFLDLQLGLWAALRKTLEEHPIARRELEAQAV